MPDVRGPRVFARDRRGRLDRVLVIRVLLVPEVLVVGGFRGRLKRVLVVPVLVVPERPIIAGDL
jgi:hypothetical protein